MIPPSDQNFRKPDGNIIVVDLEAASEEQRAFFFRQFEQEIFRLKLKEQSDGRN